MKHTGKSASRPTEENTPFAPIELLDPPPAAERARRTRHYERALGLLLLVVIAGLSLWQVATETRRLTAYQRGIHAAAAQDWSTARVAYQAAEGYGDAARQAAVAGGLAEEAGTLVQQAVAAERLCDVAGLATALGALQSIAPRAAETVRLSRDLANAPNWRLWCRPSVPTAARPAPYPLLLAYPTLCAAGDRIDCNR
jgi:hypothetical protein